MTLHTDYAFRTLIYLETQKDRLVSISEIARLYQISESHLIKVVHRLSKRGVVQAFRGRKGGVRLARPAHEIYLGDVIRCIEDDLPPAACLQAQELPKGCLLVGGCRLKQTLIKAQHAFMDVLDEVTLADVTARHERTVLMQTVHAMQEDLMMPSLMD
nr:Rrf2 family transcriptional regulator [Saccharibacter sp. 17.LH.SD]